MLKRILLILSLILFTVPAYAGGAIMVLAAGSSAAAAPVCDLGSSRTQGSTTDTWGADVAVSRVLDTASCSSTTMNKGYIYAGGTGVVLKICVYNRADTSATYPDADDTLVACSNSATFTGTGWHEATFSSNFSITATNEYYVMYALKNDSGTITSYYTTGSTGAYKATSGIFASPPNPMGVNFLTIANQGNTFMFVTDGGAP